MKVRHHTRLQPGPSVQVVRPLWTSSLHPLAGRTTEDIVTILPGQGLEPRLEKVEVSAILILHLPSRSTAPASLQGQGKGKASPMQQIYWMLKHTQSAYAFPEGSLRGRCQGWAL